MFTRIQPAGNLFAYCESAVDYLGEERPVKPQRLRGDRAVVEDFLWALAPAALRPKRSKKRGAIIRRPRPGWVRHCQEHLVHLINCYIEPHATIERNLTRILQGTEDLILAGLPRNALNFVWYKHEKEFGTHPHGGLLRQILPAGPGYVPNLNPELLFAFDRLVSRRYGLADPLDPAGMRLVYAAWASAKKENEADIEAVCAGVEQEYRRRGKDFTHAAVLDVCAGLGLPILVAPDRSGRPLRFQSDRFPELNAPLRRQTVVVASWDRQRAICFAGPACSACFDVASYEAEVEERRQRVAKLRDHPEVLYERFRHLLAERIAQQQDCYGGAEPGVTESHFTRLGEWVAPVVPEVAAWLAQAPRLQRWSERAFPFATDADFRTAYAVDFRSSEEPLDHTNPEVGLLHEACDELVVRTEAAAWQWEQQQQAIQIGTVIGQMPGREQGQLRQQVVALSLRVAVAIGSRDQAEQERQRRFHQRQAMTIAIAIGQRVEVKQRQRHHQQIQVALDVSWQVGQWHFAELRRHHQAQLDLALRSASALRERDLGERALRAHQQLRLSLEISVRVGRWHQAECERRRGQRVWKQTVAHSLRVSRSLEDLIFAREHLRRWLAVRVGSTIGLRLAIEQEEQMKYDKARWLEKLRKDKDEILQQLTSLEEELATQETALRAWDKKIVKVMSQTKSENFLSGLTRQPRRAQLEKLAEIIKGFEESLLERAELKIKIDLQIEREQSDLLQEEAALPGKIATIAADIVRREARIKQLQHELEEEKAKEAKLLQQQREQATKRRRKEAGWVAKRAEADQETNRQKVCKKFFADFAASIEAVESSQSKLNTKQAELRDINSKIDAHLPPNPEGKISGPGSR